jgi:hypothetical protein
MKVAGWRDRSEAAWDRREVGIWYGAWTASDWRDVRLSSSATYGGELEGGEEVFGGRPQGD